MTALGICCLAVASLLWRGWRRKLSRGELWIVLFVVGHFALVQLQMLISEHAMVIYWRYHLPTVALLIPLVARLFLWDAIHFLGRYKRICSVVALLLVLAVSLRCAYRPYRRYANWRRNAQTAEEWAAGVIENDWKGPRVTPYKYSSRDYRSPRLPVICGFGERISYMVKGRAAYDKLIAWNEIWADEPVDYCCFPQGLSTGYVKWVRENGGILVATRAFGSVVMEVYRMPVKIAPKIPYTEP